jgi:hypothetical protein
MDSVIAYCGLVCTDCAAYVATQLGDRAALERVAAKWREEYNAPGMTAESIRCDGCLGSDGHKCGHCSECDVRACAMARAVANCAHCPDYGCQTIEGFLSFVPDARARLDGIRAALTA